MNEWHVYEFMKKIWRRSGHTPTMREVVRAFPKSTMRDIREGMIEFQIAFKNHFQMEAEEQAERLSNLTQAQREELVRRAFDSVHGA